MNSHFIMKTLLLTIILPSLLLVAQPSYSQASLKCSSILLNLSQFDSLLNTLESQTKSELTRLGFLANEIPLQSSQFKKNNSIHESAIILNSLFDRLVQIKLMSSNRSLTPDKMVSLNQIFKNISRGLIQSSALPLEILNQMLNVRLQAMQGQNKNKNPIGFIKSAETKTDISTIKYAPKFEVIEPIYQNPYGAKDLSSNSTIENKMSTIGFIQNFNSQLGNKSAALNSIGFIQPTKFIDDLFQYQIAIHPISAEFILKKIPIN